MTVREHTGASSAPQAAVRVARLAPETVAIIRQRIVGRGGFQTLFRRIQAGLAGDVLTVEQRDLNALVRLSSAAAGRHVKGGYQQRAVTLLADLLWTKFYGPRRHLSIVRFEKRESQTRLPLEGGR